MKKAAASPGGNAAASQGREYAQGGQQPRKPLEFWYQTSSTIATSTVAAIDTSQGTLPW